MKIFTCDTSRSFSAIAASAKTTIIISAIFIGKFYSPYSLTRYTIIVITDAPISSSRLLFRLWLVFLFLASAQAVLFVHEHHSADGALGFYANGMQRTHNFNALHHTCAVIAGSFCQIP